MKNFLFALLCLSLAAPAFAAGKEGPCKKIKEACEAAGYTKGGHKNGDKGLYKDCMGKLKNGESVAGVNVSADDVAACKEKAAEHKAKKGK